MLDLVLLAKTFELCWGDRSQSILSLGALCFAVIVVVDRPLFTSLTSKKSDE